MGGRRSYSYFVQSLKTRSNTLLDFSKAFESMLREKMKQVLLASSFLKETEKKLMILNKAMIYSLDRNIDYFNTVSEVLQEDTLKPFLGVLKEDTLALFLGVLQGYTLVPFL